MTRVAALFDEWAVDDPFGDPLGPFVSSGTPLAVTFPTTALVTRASIALDADFTADPSTWAWQDITDYCRWDLGVTVRPGRPDEASTVTPGSATLKLDNRDGRFTRRNPTGPYYGLLSKNTPIWIELDAGSGYRTRAEMYVNEWPTRWFDKSANDSYVTIRCAGILRRLGQGELTKSALRRTIDASSPVAYWPLEDGLDAAEGGSGVSGGTPMITEGAVTFDFYDDLAGADGAPSVGTATLRGFVSGASATAWHAEFAMRATYGGIGAFRIYTPSTTHNTFRVFLPISAGLGMSVFITASDGSTTTSLSGTDPSNFDGIWHHYAITATQSGASVVTRYYIDGALQATDTTAGTLAAPSEVRGNPNQDATVQGIAHVAVGDGITAVGAPAVDGYLGEMAHDRIERLCDEEGIVYTSGAHVSPTMGPQPVGASLQLMREAELVDRGVLYEARWGLAYQSRDERENAPVGFTLDFDLGQIAQTPEPADDDQRLRNYVTARRSGGGSEATVTDPDSIAADGLYDDSISVNVESDSDLADQAGWSVWLGTVDVDRWPRLDMNLAHNPELIDDWTTLPFGSRINVLHPLDQLPPDPVDAFIEGYEERWNSKQWSVTLYTSPAKPYDVGTLAQTSGDTDDLLGWLDWDSCVLAAAVDTTATSWSITASPVDTTDADDFPRDVWIGGELVTVTACSGGSAPQTWTVTRSVNTVVKAHAAGAVIELAHPVVLTL